MSIVYEYVRNYSNGKYDLENKFEDVSGTNEMLPSYTIAQAFPGIKFRLFGVENVLQCVFETPLTAPQKTQLDTIISNAREII